MKFVTTVGNFLFWEDVELEVNKACSCLFTTECEIT